MTVIASTTPSSCFSVLSIADKTGIYYTYSGFSLKDGIFILYQLDEGRERGALWVSVIKAAVVSGKSPNEADRSKPPASVLTSGLPVSHLGAATVLQDVLNMGVNQHLSR